VDTPQLQKSTLRVHRTLKGSTCSATVGFVLAALVSACSSTPDTKVETFSFPKESAIVGDAKGRPYETLGTVRSKVDFNTLNPDHEEKELCDNYFNKAVRELVKQARAEGGDAVIDVKSVVFYEDGQSKTFPTAECSDDGQQGQVLALGIAVRWKRLPSVQETDVITPKDESGFRLSP
jgi:hypothetical protein